MHMSLNGYLYGNAVRPTNSWLWDYYSIITLITIIFLPISRTQTRVIWNASKIKTHLDSSNVSKGFNFVFLWFYFLNFKRTILSVDDAILRLNFNKFTFLYLIEYWWKFIKWHSGFILLRISLITTYLSFSSSIPIMIYLTN